MPVERAMAMRKIHGKYVRQRKKSRLRWRDFKDVHENLLFAVLVDGVQTMSGVCRGGRGGPTSVEEHRGGYTYKYKSAQSAITVIARASVDSEAFLDPPRPFLPILDPPSWARRVRVSPQSVTTPPSIWDDTVLKLRRHRPQTVTTRPLISDDTNLNQWIYEPQ